MKKDVTDVTDVYLEYLRNTLAY